MDLGSSDPSEAPSPRLGADCTETINLLLSDNVKNRVMRIKASAGARKPVFIPDSLQDVCEKLVPLCRRIYHQVDMLSSATDDKSTEFMKRIGARRAEIIVDNLTLVMNQLHSLWEKVGQLVGRRRIWLVRGHSGLAARCEELERTWNRFERFWETVSCEHRVAVEQARVRGRWARKWRMIYKETLHRAQRQHLLRHEDPNECMDLVLGVTEVMFPDPDGNVTRLQRAVADNWVPDRYDDVEKSRRSELEGLHILNKFWRVTRFRLCGWIGRSSWEDGLSLQPKESRYYRYMRDGDFEDDMITLFKAISPLTPPPAIARRIRIGFRLAHAVFSLHLWHEAQDSMPQFFIPEDPNERPNFAIPFLSSLFRVKLDVHPRLPPESICCTEPYRLPEVYEPNGKHEFDMFEDLYGLGVALLEIGLWDPMMARDESGVLECPSFPGLDPLGPGPYVYDVLNESGRQTLQNMVQGRLVSLTGPVYSAVVMWCLTRIESEQLRPRYAHIFNELEQLPGSKEMELTNKTPFVEFIENVLVPLDNISM